MGWGNPGDNATYLPVLWIPRGVGQGSYNSHGSQVLGSLGGPRVSLGSRVLWIPWVPWVGPRFPKPPMGSQVLWAPRASLDPGSYGNVGFPRGGRGAGIPNLTSPLTFSLPSATNRLSPYEARYQELVPGTRYQVPGTWFLVPCTWYQVPGTK